MKTTHLTPRPMRNRGERSITWARTIPAPELSDGITYRLAKRDLDGKPTVVALTFFKAHLRGEIARSLWAARAGLRATVEDRDMRILDLVEAA